MITFIFLIFAGLVSYFVMIRGPEIFPVLASAKTSDLYIITYIILAFGLLVSILAEKNRK